MTRGSDSWRALAHDEIVLLQQALLGDWAGAAELRTQLPGVQARPGCTCGCGTLDLQASSGVAAPHAQSPSPREGRVVNLEGDEVGGLLIFLNANAGRLASLEIYSYDKPLAMPTSDHVTWIHVER